jgi:hypothetical protein
MRNIPQECNIETELGEEADSDLNYLLDNLHELLQQEGECNEIPAFGTSTINKGIIVQVERIQIPKTPELENLLRMNAKFWNIANWLVRGWFFSRLKPNRIDITAQRRKLREKFLEKVKKQSSLALLIPLLIFSVLRQLSKQKFRKLLIRRLSIITNLWVKKVMGLMLNS